MCLRCGLLAFAKATADESVIGLVELVETLPSINAFTVAELAEAGLSVILLRYTSAKAPAYGARLRRMNRLTAS